MLDFYGIDRSDLAEVLSITRAQINRVLAGTRGFDGGRAALLGALLTAAHHTGRCPQTLQQLRSEPIPQGAIPQVGSPQPLAQHCQPGLRPHLPPSSASADTYVARPDRDELEHLAVIEPCSLLWSGYLDCPPTTAPIRTHASLDGLTVGFQLDESRVDELLAYCRGVGLELRDNRQAAFRWGLFLHDGDQHGFTFAALPTRRNNFGRRRGEPGRRYNAKLEIHGRAMPRAAWLISQLVAPYCVPGSLRFRRLDIAIDMELAFAAVLAWRRFPTKPPKQWSPEELAKELARPERYRRSSRWHSTFENFYAKNYTTRDVSRITSTVLAGPRTENRLTLYDKLQERVDNAGPSHTHPEAWTRLGHAQGWQHCLRVEAQLKGGAQFGGPAGDELPVHECLLRMKNPFRVLQLADLRLVEPDDPFLHLALRAKLMTVEHLYLENLDGDEPMRALLRSRLGREAARWPWPHPVQVFEEQRDRLQLELNRIFASVGGQLPLPLSDRSGRSHFAGAA